MDVKSDLLKEAIADAKAVKETALANAKIALEEAFAPRIQSMLSTKISEEMDEPMGDEMEMDMDMGADMDAPVDDAPATVTVDGKEYVPAGGAEEGGEELSMDAEVSDDMDAMGDENEPMGDAHEGMKYNAMGDEEDPSGVEEDLELEAIIRELEEDLNEEEITEELDEAHCGSGDEPAEEKKDDKELDEAHCGSGDEPAEKDDKVEESLNIDEIIEEILSEDDELNEEEIDEGHESSGIGKGTGMKQADAHTDDPQGSKLVEELEGALEESYDTIDSLRETINEVNLLNAKLLYTNKLFRNFELSEDQKMKVIENFDRAGNTREVKLVFSTLAENFTVPVKKRKVVKEGIASKPVQSTAPKTKTIINEGNQLADRWKKLAGLLD